MSATEPRRRTETPRVKTVVVHKTRSHHSRLSTSRNAEIRTLEDLVVGHVSRLQTIARVRGRHSPARCALSSRVVLRSRRRHPSLGSQHARAHHVRLVGPRRACRARPRGAIEVALVERVPSRATGVRRAESSGVVGRRGRRHHRQRRRRLDRGGAPRALRQEGDRAGVALRHRRCRARVPARNGRRGVSIRHRPWSSPASPPSTR